MDEEKKFADAYYADDSDSEFDDSVLSEFDEDYQVDFVSANDEEGDEDEDLRY